MKMKELSEQPEEAPMVLFQSDDGAVRLNVRLNGETVWLTQAAMAELFGCTADNISLHLKRIYADGELSPGATTEDSSVTAADAKKCRTRHYNLDVDYKAILPVETQWKNHWNRSHRSQRTTASKKVFR
jgi:hypothetical protein